MAATETNVTEASKMLEAALQQMDGIISGTSNNNGNSNNNFTSPSPTPSIKTENSSQMQSEMQNNAMTSDNILVTAKTLALALKQIDMNTPPPDVITASIICNWLERHQFMHSNNNNKENGNQNTATDNHDNTERFNHTDDANTKDLHQDGTDTFDGIDRFKLFQYDKEAMINEYQSMMDKVSSQSHKIIELESLLAEKTQQMSTMEEQLQRHICTRSELETQKLELITALSELKLHRATIERENYALKAMEHQQQQQHQQYGYIAGNHNSHTTDVNDSDNKLNSTMLNASNNSNHYPHHHGGNNDVIDVGKIHYEDVPIKPKTPPASVRQKLQTHFHSLPRSHCLKMTKPKLPWATMMFGTAGSQHSNYGKDRNQKDGLDSHEQQQQQNDNDIDTNGNRQVHHQQQQHQQRYIMFNSNEKILSMDENGQQHQPSRRMTSTVTNHSNKNLSGDLIMYHSYIDQLPKNQAAKIISTQPLLSTNLRERSKKSICHLLGKLRRSNSGQLESMNMNMSEEDERLTEFRRGDRARLTAGGRIEWSTNENRMDIDIEQQTDDNKTIKTMKKWSEWNEQDIYKWLNSLSLNCYIDDCDKWLKNNPELNFFTMPINDVLDSLNIKMVMHRKKIQMARDELMNKETDHLTIKSSQLDVNWVIRWLDDIGLPQYKDAFYLHRVDGRLLHRLTMDELLIELRIHSALHIASLRRGIQCMREMEWNPDCLIRRSSCEFGLHNTHNHHNNVKQSQHRNSSDYLMMMMMGGAGEPHSSSLSIARNHNNSRNHHDNGAGDSNNSNSSNTNINNSNGEDNNGNVDDAGNHVNNREDGEDEYDGTSKTEHSNDDLGNISLWTAHRVMEWLRAVDLSEYAPNLRGAGVHGALMLYEDRFNANLLADLLSIPTSKTLLRRHLATHFKELLGREVIQQKREAETSVGYQPLTITAKLKPPKAKRTQFSLKKRSKNITKPTANESDWIEYVCPMENHNSMHESSEFTSNHHHHHLKKSTTSSSSSTNISNTFNNTNTSQ